MRPAAQSVFSRSRLLGTMLPDDFERMQPHLKRIALPVRHVLEEANKPIEYVYFLEPAVASIVAITPHGPQIEVGLFGPEGMSGLAILNGADRSPLQTLIQVPGQGLRMSADAFRQSLEDSPTLRGLLLRYAQAHAIQVAYTAFANGQFTIDERMARWLLMCHDRVDGDVIQLTHEFLAIMLGIRRAGVTSALGLLERGGVIRLSRSRIEVTDRVRLQEIAGNCYGVPEAEYERLLGSS